MADLTYFAIGALGSEARLSSNDATLNITVEDIFRETRVASGTLKRYTVAQKLHFQFAYKYLFAKTRDVYDSGLGYNALFALKVADQEMNFLSPSDSGAQTAYTVRFAIGTWRSSIVFRSSDVWAYSLNFELVQV